MNKIILMSGSLRKDSVNSKLIKITQKILTDNNSKLLSFNDYEMPLYNGDFEEAHNIPDEASSFANEIKSSSHLIFALPEYNGLMPGVFKNFFDWVSRVRPMPWSNKKILIITATPSALGGIRGFTHNRMPFESCGAFVFPKSFFLANAYTAFDDQNNLISEAEHNKLNLLIDEFIKF